MRRKVLLFALPLMAMLAATGAWAESELVKRFSDEQLVNILQADGYNAVSIVEPGEILIKIDGRPHVLFVEDDGDLRAYYAITGVKISYEDINTWNRNKRLSRAFLDDDKDPVLESDLMANAGMSPKHVTEFFRVFTDSTNAFRNFILKHDKK